MSAIKGGFLADSASLARGGEVDVRSSGLVPRRRRVQVANLPRNCGQPQRPQDTPSSVTRAEPGVIILTTH